jgi:hypothetical protein
MRKLIGSALVLAAVVLVPAESLAQRRPPARRAPPAPVQRTSFGAELALGTETDFGIGARVVFGLRSLFRRTPIDGQVGFQYFFPSKPAGTSFTYWEINGNLAYRIPNMRGNLAPYVGGGLNIAHASVDVPGLGGGSNTEVGLNFLAGTTLKVRGTTIPFAEARVRAGGGPDQLVLAAGARFQL